LIIIADRKNIAELQYNSRLIADAWERFEAESKCAWCWHCSGHESAAMWKLYADAGAAIQTTLHRIEPALPDTINFDVGKVRYCNKETGNVDSVNPEGLQNQALLARSYF